MTPNLQTGDLVLMSGGSHFAKLIKEAMGVPWSHLAIAIRNNEMLGVWEATGRGVGITRWSKALPEPADYFTRTMNPRAGDVAVRRLIWPTHDAHERREAENGLRRHIELHAGKHYENDKRQLFAVAYPSLSHLIHGAIEEDLSAMFCWECVSAAYKAMGLLSEDRAAHTYPITEYLGDLPLLRGVKFGALEYLTN
jgi:hypothetical protein